MISNVSRRHSFSERHFLVWVIRNLICIDSSRSEQMACPCSSPENFFQDLGLCEPGLAA